MPQGFHDCRFCFESFRIHRSRLHFLDGNVYSSVPDAFPDLKRNLEKAHRKSYLPLRTFHYRVYRSAECLDDLLPRHLALDLEHPQFPVGMTEAIDN